MSDLGILAYFRWLLGTNLVEGTYNKIKVIKRVTYGYRDDAYFLLRIRAASQSWVKNYKKSPASAGPQTSVAVTRSTLLRPRLVVGATVWIALRWLVRIYSPGLPVVGVVISLGAVVVQLGGVRIATVVRLDVGTVRAIVPLHRMALSRNSKRARQSDTSGKGEQQLFHFVLLGWGISPHSLVPPA